MITYLYALRITAEGVAVHVDEMNFLALLKLLKYHRKYTQESPSNLYASYLNLTSQLRLERDEPVAVELLNIDDYANLMGYSIIHYHPAAEYSTVLFQLNNSVITVVSQVVNMM